MFAAQTPAYNAMMDAIISRPALKSEDEVRGFYERRVSVLSHLCLPDDAAYDQARFLFMMLAEGRMQEPEFWNLISHMPHGTSWPSA